MGICGSCCKCYEYKVICMDIIVIYYSYKPNVAAVNRLLSFLHGFEKIGVNVEMVFIYPNENGDRVMSLEYNHVHFNYLWDKYKCRNKYYKFVRSFWDLYQYIKRLQPGAKVLLLSSSEYLPFITWRSDIEVFHERTEHPDVAKTIPSFLQKSYLKACTKATGLFVISTSLKKYFNRLGVRKISIVNMTVDVGRFLGIEKQQLNEHYIAYCGAASNNKDGVDILIKAFAIVHKYYPSMKLYIIGKAPKQNDESGNMELVKDLNLSDVVLFTGVVQSEKIPQILMDADMLVLARPDSLQAQCGFPTKLGEYLLTGNPVVITNVGDIPLFFEDQVNALIAEPGDVEGFAAKMKWVIENPVESKVIGEQGKKVALSHFNYFNEVKKIVNAIC